MLRRALLVFAALALSGFLYLRPLQVDSRMRDFQLTGADGARFRLSEHRGKLVVLNFFANW